MSLVLDAAGLLALERNERASWVRLKSAHSRGELPLTNSAVVGQVWRGSARQARLSLALSGMVVMALDESKGRASGQLLGAAGLTDLVDASLVLVAHDGDEIITSDAGDLRRLVEVCGLHVELMHP